MYMRLAGALCLLVNVTDLRDANCHQSVISPIYEQVRSFGFREIRKCLENVTLQRQILNKWQFRELESFKFAKV